MTIEARASWLRGAQERFRTTGRVFLDCPVGATVIQSTERFAGRNPANPMIYQAAHERWQNYQEYARSEQDIWYEIPFTPGPQAVLQVTALADGVAHLVVFYGATASSGYYYLCRFKAGQVFRLPLDREGRFITAPIQAVPRKFDAATIDQVLAAMPATQAGRGSSTGSTSGPTATTPAGSSAGGAKPPASRPTGEGRYYLDNRNAAGVSTGNPPQPTSVTFDRPVRLDQIRTYHWNNGQGAAPGTIALQDSSGKRYGPWQAVGIHDNAGRRNLWWEVTPKLLLPAGTYRLLDSDPATWSHNQQSGGRGIALVWGVPH